MASIKDIISDAKDMVSDAAKFVVETKDAVAEKVNDGVNLVADAIRDHRKAQVVVVNETGGAVRNVHVKHRYSSNFRSARTWATLEAGATSSPPLDVDHATGPATTGLDWWFVCWTDADGNLHHNDGGPALGLLNAAEDVVSTVTKVLSPGTGAVAALTGAVGVNVESYNGHTLSSKAGERPVRIVLKSDSVTFDSRDTKDETFKLHTVQSADWKGWDPAFEKLWILDQVTIAQTLHSRP